MAVISSKEFNQRASAVLKLSQTEPVYITKWGKIVSVLSNYADFQAQRQPKTLADAFAQTHKAGGLDSDFERAFDDELARIRQSSAMRTPDLAEWE